MFNSLSRLFIRIHQFFARLVMDRNPDVLPKAWMYQIIQNNPLGMVLVDAQHPDLTIIYANKAFERNTGYSLAEIIGKNPRLMQGNDRNQEGRALIRAAIQHHEACIVVMRNYRKNGEMFWNELHITPIFDQHGTVTHYLGMQNDITARKEAELRYRSLFEQSNDAVFILDLSGQHIEVNQQAADMLGYSPDEIKNLSYRDLVAPEQQPASQNVLQRLLAGERVPPYERTFRRKDGSILPTEVNVEIVWNEDGTPLHIQSIVRDISGRKQIENELRQSERNLRMALQGTRAGTWEWNVVTGETVFNQRWAEIAGYTLDELAPISIQTWLRLVHPDDLAVSNHALERYFAGETAYYECEARIRHKDGHWIWILDSGMVMDWTPDGRPLRMMGTHIDITEHKQAQRQEFQLALEKERISLLTQFMQNTAHEFRTPLSIIETSAYLISRLEDPERRRIKVEQIELQVKRITHLVDMLLMMIKLESEKAIRSMPVNVAALLDMTCDSIKVLYGDKPQIKYEIPTDLPIIIGDMEYLGYAFNQIVDNACRFTPPEGMITVSAGVCEHHLWIKVADTGIGITQENLPHIFEVFWRHDEVHTTPGFGLGLPIACRIIEHHGGKIEVSSEVGQGTSVLITLPVGQFGTEKASQV